MTKAQDDHEQRLLRISEKLANLQSVSADTHEEVLVATEQLIEHALAAHRESVAASQRARADSAHERTKRRPRNHRLNP